MLLVQGGYKGKSVDATYQNAEFQSNLEMSVPVLCTQRRAAAVGGFTGRDTE